MKLYKIGVDTNDYDNCVKLCIKLGNCVLLMTPSSKYKNRNDALRASLS